MKQISKTALERLAGAGPNAAADSAGAHPDANLLSAFAERSLAAAERERVYEHLALCAECRAEVQLALRASGAANEAEAAPVGQRPSPAVDSGRRRALGWQALAASTALAAVMSFELAIHLGTRFTANRPGQGSLTPAAEATRAPALEAQNRIPASAKAAAPAAVPLAERQALKARLKKTPLTSNSALAEGGAPVAASALEAGQEASSNAPLPSQPKTSPAAARDALSEVEAAPQPPPSPGAAGGVAAGSAGAAAVSPAPASPAMRAAMGTPAKAAAKRNAPAAPRPAMQFAGELSAPRAELAAASAGVAQARWLVAPALAPQAGSGGDLERSLDGGRTWERVAVNGGERFRTVFAAGNEVWAGGNAGALYHSSDGGRNWQPVALASAAGKVTSDVTSIRFADSRHGQVGMSDGTLWMTTNGGRSWLKLP